MPENEWKIKHCSLSYVRIISDSYCFRNCKITKTYHLMCKTSFEKKLVRYVDESWEVNTIITKCDKNDDHMISCNLGIRYLRFQSGMAYLTTLSQESFSKAKDSRKSSQTSTWRWRQYSEQHKEARTCMALVNQNALDASPGPSQEHWTHTGFPMNVARTQVVAGPSFTDFWGYISRDPDQMYNSQDPNRCP